MVQGIVTVVPAVHIGVDISVFRHGRGQSVDRRAQAAFFGHLSSKRSRKLHKQVIALNTTPTAWQRLESMIR